MKKIYALMIALFLVNGAMAQTVQPCSTCLPQGVTFYNQLQIDIFQTQYPGCTEILGFVKVKENMSSGNITNLNGLSVLTSIGGDFTFENNDALTNLTGLESLSSIGGNVFIQDNPVLGSLTGLEGLTSVGGWLSIGSNPALTNLTGLDNLSSIGGGLSIDINPALTNLTGLGNLSSIGSDLDIGLNPTLTSLTGLEGVTSIGGSLILNNNDALTNLTGLEGVTSIGGDLGIYDNAALNSLVSLSNLTSIGGFLIIGDYYNGGNPALTSLTGLDNLTYIGGGFIEITYNEMLSNCAVLGICNFLLSPVGGFSDILDNAPGCNSFNEVVDSCAWVGFNAQKPQESMTTYPNPASTDITIESSTPGQLSILNLNGQPIITRQVKEAKTVVDISTLPNGVYVVKVVGEKGVQVGKFIKQ